MIIKRNDSLVVELIFYDTIDDNVLELAVIISRYHGKWEFCKHRE